MQLLFYTITFAVVVLAAWQIGRFAARLRLPLISGYLLAGMLAGPFVLDIVHQPAIGRLWYIDEVSLAVIAFAAGGEFYLKELRSRLRNIAWTTAGLTLATFTLGSTTVFLLADFIPFMRAMPTSARFGIAALAGAILVARSPSSAIAVVHELRARGPFTKTILGVTIVMDSVVIILFAINSSLADALMTQLGFDARLVGLLTAELVLSVVVSAAVALVLDFILGRHIRAEVKVGLILVTGYLMFVLSSTVRRFTHDHLTFEVFLEPLLIGMLAGFFVVNWSQYRAEFLRILTDIGPAIYVVFFTLTGASLALDTLAQTWMLTLALFGARLIGIFLGSFGGGAVAGSPMRHNRVAWMAYITQAGVGIGLAQEVAVEFPAWGAAFATTMIAVIVLNQLVGPPLLKTAIRRVGEAHLPAAVGPGEQRAAVILGIEGQSLALARQLLYHDWNVVMADTDRSHVEQYRVQEVDERWIPEITEDTLSGLLNGADALVAALNDDDASLRACELAYEKFGVPRLIVRLNDPRYTNAFAQLGAYVVDPASAMVNLLDQFVRAPQSAILLHADPEYDTAQVAVADPDIAGNALRDLRFPDDVVVLSITRQGHSIVPHGYTVLELGDEVSVVGRPESLDDVTRRFSY
jgi:Trk K+ transport system NAD-binding subunit/predicted Kef-type K+ transport protein